MQIESLDSPALREEISKAEAVVSLVPPDLHPQVAQVCLEEGRHFLSASYESEWMRQHEKEIEAKGLLFINEAGLDPGIDHVSALELIEKVKAEGYTINRFESHTGGLPAKENNNSWGYIFFWSPMNVVLAGKDGARYRDDGRVLLKPYPYVFDVFNSYKIGGDEFEMYPNRDSLPYIKKYGLEESQDFIRGTLRYGGYCDFWNIGIHAGLTNNSIRFEKGEITISDIDRMVGNACSQIDNGWWQNGKWKEIFRQCTDTDLVEGTLAENLLALLKKVWSPLPTDRDRVVMIHKLDTVHCETGEKSTFTSTLDLNGDNRFSAMTRTVGIPLAICLEEMAINNVNSKGLATPMTQELQKLIWKKLPELGVIFKEDKTQQP